MRDWKDNGTVLLPAGLGEVTVVSPTAEDSYTDGPRTLLISGRSTHADPAATPSGPVTIRTRQTQPFGGVVTGWYTLPDGGSIEVPVYASTTVYAGLVAAQNAPSAIQWAYRYGPCEVLAPYSNDRVLNDATAQSPGAAVLLGQQLGYPPPPYRPMVQLYSSSDGGAPAEWSLLGPYGYVRAWAPVSPDGERFIHSPSVQLAVRQPSGGGAADPAYVSAVWSEL